jgi:hypothetical protein
VAPRELVRAASWEAVGEKLRELVGKKLRELVGKLGTTVRATVLGPVSAKPVEAIGQHRWD